MQACRVHPEQECRQSYNEDGPYISEIGWRLVAVVPNTEGGHDYYGHHTILRLDAAERLQSRVEAAGLLLNPQHWDHLYTDNRTWQDIEEEWSMVAERERMGLPL